MVKSKMESFQLNSHIEDYADLDMDNIRNKYSQAKDHVDTMKQELNAQMDKYYDQFVRRDPARPLYNY